MNSREYCEFGGQFHLYVRGMKKKKGSNLGRFWLSHLELCELMLNLIYASRIGSWDLNLSCIDVIPGVFAYDRQNYARYLIPFLNDMRRLCETNPIDKTIKNTINRDCKTGGGYIGFSANFAATQRWVLNDTSGGEYRKLLREHLSLTSPQTYIHKDLAPARIKEDIKARRRKAGKSARWCIQQFMEARCSIHELVPWYRSDNRSLLYPGRGGGGRLRFLRFLPTG